MFKIGDYVLATKYSDGCAQDPFCVGFYAGTNGQTGRHMIVDSSGKPFRAGGYGYVRKGSPHKLAWIAVNAEWLELHSSGRSLYGWLRRTSKQLTEIRSY